MLSNKETINESTPLPQNHDVGGTKRFFPELLNKLNKHKAKKAHDVKDRKIVSVKKEGDVVVNEAKHHFTVVGHFGEKKYKNIKQAQRTASVPTRVPKGEPEVNYAPVKHSYITQKKAGELERAVGYKTPKPIQKFRDFTRKVQHITSNPIATGKALVGSSVKKTFKSIATIKKPDFTKTTFKQPKTASQKPQRTAGDVGSTSPETSPTTRKKRTADDVLSGM